jgi:hypothetical protein
MQFLYLSCDIISVATLFLYPVQETKDTLFRWRLCLCISIATLFPSNFIALSFAETFYFPFQWFSDSKKVVPNSRQISINHEPDLIYFFSLPGLVGILFTVIFELSNVTQPEPSKSRNVPLCRNGRTVSRRAEDASSILNFASSTDLCVCVCVCAWHCVRFDFFVCVCSGNSHPGGEMRRARRSAPKGAPPPPQYRYRQKPTNHHKGTEPAELNHEGVCVCTCPPIVGREASRGTTRDTHVNLAATNSQPGVARIIQLTEVSLSRIANLMTLNWQIARPHPGHRHILGKSFHSNHGAGKWPTILPTTVWEHNISPSQHIASRHLFG